MGRRLFWRTLGEAFVVMVCCGLAIVSCSDSDSPTEPADGGLVASIFGSIGCSNTRDAIQGYEQAGAGRFWPVGVFDEYGGASLELWANPNDEHWELFQAGYDAHGMDAAWFQICVRERVDPRPTATDLMMAEAVIDELRRRAPGASVYVSPLNEYDGIVCDLTGPAGPAVTEAIADHLITLGMAMPGPVVGPLTEGTTMRDRCHANGDGRIFQGEQLASFFDVR